mgnify:CR=1 FL=1
MEPVIIVKSDQEACLIESSVNSVRISIKIKKGMEIEALLTRMLERFMALRADHWLHLHPEASVELKKSIKAQIFNAFYTDTDEWRAQIISQARDAMAQAIQGLK